MININKIINYKTKCRLNYYGYLIAFEEYCNFIELFFQN